MTTKGEYRVGIAFNPSADSMVGQIKAAAAALIDLVETIDPQDNPEVGRLKAMAQSEIEAGAMWAVKAATKPPMPVDLARYPAAPMALKTGSDPFIEAVHTGVVAVMGSIGPWPHPKRLGESEFLHILGHIQKRGFNGATEKDITDIIEGLRRAGGVK